MMAPATGDCVVVIDGGGTKTDLAVLGLDGDLQVRRRLASFTPQAVGPAAAARRVDDAVRSALAQCGNPTVAVAGVYFSGLDFPFEVAAFRAEIEQQDWTGRKLLVENDTFAVLRAGTPDTPAVAVVCGTGMNCVGRARDGRVVRFAAIGEPSGDWGGGWSLGVAAIWHAARAADGRGPATALETAVLSTLGRSGMDDVIAAFHVGDLSQHLIPSLAPVVFEAADDGDPVAISVVQRQADEIVAFAAAALRRLDLLTEPCPVILGGGIIAARHRLLMAGIEAVLAAAAPNARPLVISDPPICGAALLAFDELEATSGVQERVRAAFATAGSA